MAMSRIEFEDLHGRLDDEYRDDELPVVERDEDAEVVFARCRLCGRPILGGDGPHFHTRCIAAAENEAQDRSIEGVPEHVIARYRRAA